MLESVIQLIGDPSRIGLDLSAYWQSMDVIANKRDGSADAAAPACAWTHRLWRDAETGARSSFWAAPAIHHSFSGIQLVPLSCWGIVISGTLIARLAIVFTVRMDVVTLGLRSYCLGG